MRHCWCNAARKQPVASRQSQNAAHRLHQFAVCLQRPGCQVTSRGKVNQRCCTAAACDLQACAHAAATLSAPADTLASQAQLAAAQHLFTLASEAVTFTEDYSWFSSWSADQLAGIAFAVLMAAGYFGSPIIDDYVAQGQRKELGLCTKCGGVFEQSDERCPEEDCPKRQKTQ